MNKLLAFLILPLIMTATSCSVPKNVAYFQDTESNAVLAMAPQKPISVKPGDKLSIVVKSKNANLSELYNLPIYSSRIGNSTAISGTGSEVRNYGQPSGDNVASYTVDPEGDIDFPVIGKMHISGMSRSELAAYVKGELVGRGLLKDPTVIVEFLNSGVNVMGEVTRPGRYDLNKDNLTIIEAITLAGDLTINGQRKNVKVMRQQDDGLHTYVIDLTDAGSMVESPAYYLQQNDVIYVEPDKIKKRNTTVNGNNTLSIGFWMSVASVLASVVTTIAVFINK